MNFVWPLIAKALDERAQKSPMVSLRLITLNLNSPLLTSV